MTPYELTILIDVFTGTPISVAHDAPIYGETVAALVQAEYMRPYGNEPRFEGQEFAPTEKLRVLMGYILSAPEPVWRMPC